MSMITDEVIDRVIALSELELKDDEKEIIKNDMEMMIEFFDVLKEVDMLEESMECDSMGYNTVGCDTMNIFREDVVTLSKNDSITDNIIENVPKIEEGFIVVPKTVK